MSKPLSKIIALVTVFAMLFSADAYAGKGSQKYGKQKQGFFCKVGAAIKKASQKAAKAVKTAAKKTGKAIKNAAVKTGKAIKNAAVKTGQAIKNAAVKTGQAIKTGGAKISNAAHDSAVWAKQKITGKKNKTWVCGHYDKNGVWVKGHWRKLKSNTKPGSNHPGQGNYPGQSGDPLPPVGDEPGFPGGDEGLPGGDEGFPGGDETMPGNEQAPEDPVLPELPGDEGMPGDQSQESEQTGQSEQSSQASQTEESEEDTQSGESEQASQFQKDTQISLRTMGMLMNDIIAESGEITNFKRTSNGNISYSMDTQVNITATYESRDKNARLLARVIVWDLQNNNGKPGKYFSFFMHKMKNTSAADKKLINDVIEQVKSGVKHGAGHAEGESKASYELRLSDISNF